MKPQSSWPLPCFFSNQYSHNSNTHHTHFLINSIPRTIRRKFWSCRNNSLVAVEAAAVMGSCCLCLLSFLFLLALCCLQVATEAKCGDEAVIFNFGDSNSDTGGLAAGLGYSFPLPEGRVFFKHSTGRLCDGRLLIDFLCENLNTSYLSSYLDSLGSKFKNGANFAVAGSATLPRNSPFNLYIQLKQFLYFKQRSLALTAQGAKDLITEEGFNKALYMIDIGQNDLAGGFPSNLTYDQVIARIPSVLSEIKNAIKTIYDSGGKKFWVHNTGPLGCLPQKLWQLNKDGSDLDPFGCLKTPNNAAKEFNTGLRSLCSDLRTELNDATIVYNDIYSIKYNLIANYTKYDFLNPFMACCGYGGPPYNYNINFQCLAPGFSVCAEGSRYISWDGVHFSDDANALITSRLLTTDYSEPKLNFNFFCS